MTCDVNDPVNNPNGAVEIHLCVNGVRVDDFELTWVHKRGQSGGVTLTGHTILRLERGDVLTLKIVPLVQNQYYIGLGHARMTVKKEPWW